MSYSHSKKVVSLSTLSWHSKHIQIYFTKVRLAFGNNSEINRIT